ncbi:hypothetical protein [Streptomyces naganishii]|uniref:Uncharacterized protein n=1 Tax=Streptomyces naganishii JCM 4654 TaxID=1306179 RepID=A0A918Y977_9ACTN|nr:hypothetical protein [Streptomyces naganishii]GHD93660.1 hypothetical protein GCM10010508_51420 [Streptomyces naganishii JCM 4654]
MSRDEYLLPAAMRELPAPWNDLTHRRSAALAELSPEGAAQALEVLRASLPRHRHSMHGWDEELRDAYDDRDDHTLDEADAWLTRLMPTTADVTRERVAEVLVKWSELGVPTVSSPPTRQQIDLTAAEWATSVRQALASDAFAHLGRGAFTGHEAEAAGLAAAYVRVGLAVESAVRLLMALGRPHGEDALLELVHDDEVGDFRQYVRSRLLVLRRPGHEARGRQPVRGEEPLLPAAVREIPYGWATGFQWPPTLPVTEENVARARAVLLAGAPAGPVPEPVPSPAWSGRGGEEPPPAWLETRQVMRELMPYASHVTRERMTEAMRECALLGIPGVPRDPAGEEGTRFVRRWVTWIGGWIAGEVFNWLGTYVGDGALLTPWATELAERYARCGVAADQAVSMLRQHHTTAGALAALGRIAADDTLPPLVRKEATL